MTTFSMFGKIKAHPGKRDELLAILLEASQILKEVEGCEHYIINTSDDDPDGIWVWELWRDAEAHANSLKNEQGLNTIMRGKPLIAEIKPLRLRPVGGRGMP